MRTIVTAVLVAREGGEWLSRTAASLAAQTRAPDRIIAVANGGGEALAQQLAESGATHVVTLSAAAPFGAAVAQALQVVPGQAAAAGPAATVGAAASSNSTSADASAATPEADMHEWLWLLSEDAAPEPEALARILRTVQRSPSVAVAGPKLVDWDHPERIIELGQSLTMRGQRWLLRRQELDQQQYDHLQDVLGVGPVGMLVRRDVWAQLGGFDPALPVYDDGLDFCVRARLSGYRVVVAPDSRIGFAQLGVAGPRIDRSRRVLRKAYREGQVAQLHRRISYAPALFAFFMWLGLPILAVARVAWALIREHPGRMWGEFAAAMRVFFTPGSILASRRRIRRLRGPGWSAVKPLRIDTKTVRTTRMIEREAILASQGRRRGELHFISNGGLAVLVTALVATAVLCWWALTMTSVSGGALAPLSPIAELWQNTRSQGGVPADPFTWVLAVLGSLTFWNPSHAIVLMLIAAIPLAALGGWIWAANITQSNAGRALLGLGWAFSPVLLGSLAAGRLSTLILAAVLPWLLLAATRCRESWSWAGTASLLAAVVLACAPVLLPVAVIALIVGLFSSVRGIARVLATAIAPLALFAPKLIALIGGAPLDLIVDPGITPAYVAGSPRHLMLGFPEFGLEGWADILAGVGLGDAPATLLVGVLFVLIIVLAVLGVVTARVRATLLLAGLGALGLATAVASAHVRLVSQGDETIALWTGSGLAVYWVSVLSLAAIGCTVLRRAAPPIVAATVALALLAVAPLGVKLVTADTGFQAGDAQLPAIVEAAGTANPELRTLVLTAEGDHAVRAEVIVGSGVRLDDIRTAERVRSLDAHDERVAALVGALASTGSAEDLAAQLATEGIGFVLLGTGGDDIERVELQGALDQSVALSSAGQTAHGLLWRVQGAATLDGASAEGAAGVGVDAGAGVASETEDPPAVVAGIEISVTVLWWAQVIVLLAMLLLALPTGEVVDRPERRRRPAGPAGAPEPAPAPGTPESADGAPDTPAGDPDAPAAATTEAPAEAPADPPIAEPTPAETSHTEDASGVNRD